MQLAGRRLAGGAYNAPSDPLTGFRGLLLREEMGGTVRKRRGRKGSGGKRRRELREGRG